MFPDSSLLLTVSAKMSEAKNESDRASNLEVLFRQVNDLVSSTPTLYNTPALSCPLDNAGPVLRE